MPASTLTVIDSKSFVKRSSNDACEATSTTQSGET